MNKDKKSFEDKFAYILKRLGDAADITICDICGDVMVAPLGFDIAPVCSKIDCNYKFLKDND
jgi:hypothetical protein